MRPVMRMTRALMRTRDVGVACVFSFACACDSRTGMAGARVDVAGTSGPPALAAPDAALACASCHAAEVLEWRTSQHQVSFMSPDFQRSYRAERRELCVDCHAPLRTADGARDVASGIGCNACHVVSEGHVAQTAGDRPHVTTKACASCHDFDFPGTRAILQSTEREHAQSPFAATPCAGCHMKPRARGLRDHRFDVTRNRELLADAIYVQSTRFTGDVVIVTLATKSVGHRFPTGDIFRRLTLTLTALNEDGDVIAGDTFHMGRDWDGHRASQRAGITESATDTRLTEAPREFRLASPRRPASVHATVDYERGASAEGDFFESFETMEILNKDLRPPATSANVPVPVPAPLASHPKTPTHE